MAHTLRRRWWLLLLGVFVVLAGGFAGWASLAAPPMPEAQAALQPDTQVTVSTGPWLVFQPTGQDPATGLIFYPGARVDARAYAPPARTLAAAGYLVVITPMPLNLAILASDRAADVISAYPHVQHWAVGGHSLGGAMAAQFAYQHPAAVDGLVLWAAYPPDGDDLSQRDLAVVSISGTRDGLATPAKIAASHPLLPASTHWVALDGGNHAQFGWYGAQDGDNPATISRAAQQQQIISATLTLLAGLK
jgi:hypothetical protein